MPREGIVVILLAAATGALGASQAPLAPVVEVEETAFTYADGRNGSEPTWCNGSTIIVRGGKDVFVSAYEIIDEQKPMNNVRWALLKRTDAGWQRVQADEKGRTREPSPLACFPTEGKVFLSVNPTLTGLDAEGGPAQPQVLTISAAHPEEPYTTETPVWDADADFGAHSYRGFAADAANRELLLLQIHTNDRMQMWSFRDRTGKWSAHGKLPFRIYQYDQPTVVRSLYPLIVLKDREAVVVGNSGTIEPNAKWAEHRRSLGNQWPYVRRQLFLAWTPDIVSKPFTEWKELVNLDATAGQVMQNDICMTADGLVHILWHEMSTDLQLRDAFLPGVPLRQSLHHGVVRDGELIRNEALAEGGEGIGEWVPTWSRFHQTPDGRLLVIYDWTNPSAPGGQAVEDRLMELLPEGGHSDPVLIPVKHPIKLRLLAANTRFGCEPSDVIDLIGYPDSYGTGGELAMRYARIRVK
jgi:hypothetical protein